MSIKFIKKPHLLLMWFTIILIKELFFLMGFIEADER